MPAAGFYNSVTIEQVGAYKLVSIAKTTVSKLGSGTSNHADERYHAATYAANC